MNGSLTVFARRDFQNEGPLRDWPRSSVTGSVFQPDRTALRLLLVAHREIFRHAKLGCYRGMADIEQASPRSIWLKLPASSRCPFYFAWGCFRDFLSGSCGRTAEQDQATLSRNASSAACTASGVPTCIQTPSSRRPNSRSCSLARSNILVSENSPAGASANSEGDMIAAPA